MALFLYCILYSHESWRGVEISAACAGVCRRGNKSVDQPEGSRESREGAAWSDPGAFRHCDDDPAQHIERIGSKGAAQDDQFRDIDPALTGFDPRDKGLVALQALCQSCLCQSG